MKLKTGDTIGIIAPSGPIIDKDTFFKNVDIIRHKGFDVKIFPHVFYNADYLAGDDTERLEDFHNAFLNKEISAILCARGGYGALRLVDKIDFEIVKNNPKIFIGSSDATILLAVLYCNAGLKSFHGPMLMRGFASDNFENHIKLINDAKEILPKKKHKVLLAGEAKGVLWGGNLATLVSLFGSDNYMPDDDIILFLEDINEPLYKIDKMLLQIYRNKFLREKIKGMIFGEFTGLNKEDFKNLEKLILEYVKLFNVPSVFGFDISHGKNNTIIPFGRGAKLFGAKIYLL